MYCIHQNHSRCACSKILTLPNLASYRHRSYRYLLCPAVEVNVLLYTVLVQRNSLSKNHRSFHFGDKHRNWRLVFYLVDAKTNHVAAYGFSRALAFDLIRQDPQLPR